MLSANLGILVLDPTGIGALTRTGNNTIAVTNGDIVIDSSSTSAGKFSGNGSVSANNIDVTGKLSNSGGKVVGTVVTGSPALADPLAALPQPTAPPTKFTNTSINGKTVTLSPGTYVNGITISGNSNVTLQPGLYYLQGGGFHVQGNSKISGAGVTIFNAPVKSTDAINFAGNTTLTLSAPASGIYQGIVIFQSRTSNVPLTFAASSMKLTGEVYAAGALLSISGNVSDSANGNGTTIPGALIVRDLTLNGNGSLSVVANVGGLMGDLSVTKTDNVGGKYSAGGNITYTVTVANTGPSEAIGATVSDPIPAAITSDTYTIVTTGGAVNVTHAASGNGSINDTVILPTGSSITYTVSATISASAVGQLVNTATVTAPGTFKDTNLANNSATVVDNSTADLAIIELIDNQGGSSGAGGGPAATGSVLSSGTIQYTIVVTNNGPGGVLGAIVSDSFPTGIASDTFTVATTGGAADLTNAASGSGNISDTVNLPTGSTITYVVTANISAIAAGTLTDTASVAAPAGVVDPTPANNTATDSDTFSTSSNERRLVGLCDHADQFGVGRRRHLGRAGDHERGIVAGQHLGRD